MKRVFIALASCLFTTGVLAAGVDLTWSNPTLHEDGTDIPATGQYSLVSTEIDYSICLAGTVDPNNTTTVSVAAPLESHTIDPLAPGDYCFFARAVNTEGTSSDVSNLAVKTVAPPTPAPPSNLTVTDLVVYTVLKQENRFVLVGVGTVPANTPCDPNQSVNGHNAVPLAAVQWAGTVRPQVVVAKCS